MWQLLKLYIKQQRIPLVLDIEAGPEVWNFPAYAYKVTYRPLPGGNQQIAKLTLWFADDFVPPDYVGVKERSQEYSFTFELRGNKIVAGSAKWHGLSVKDHPDFAWFPTVQRAENPEIDYPKVRQFLGLAAIGGTPVPPAPPVPPVPPANPTPPDDLNDPPSPTPLVGASATQLRPADAIVLNPWELLRLVANKIPLDVTVDRFDGGQYVVGEPIVVSGSSGKAGYLYLLRLDSQGDLRLLYPQPGQDNHIEPNRKFTFPRPEDPFMVTVDQPLGVSRIKAIVTSKRLVLSGLALNPQRQPHSQTQTQLGQPNQEEVKPQQKPQQQKQQQSNPEQIKLQPEQSQLQQSKPNLQWQEFRWPPSQQRQFQQLLAQFQRDERLSQEMLELLDPRTYLGEFAQDEVAFYVGPKEAPQTKSGSKNEATNEPQPAPLFGDKPQSKGKPAGASAGVPAGR